MWLYSAVSIDPRNALAVAHRVPSCPVKAWRVSWRYEFGWFVCIDLIFCLFSQFSCAGARFAVRLRISIVLRQQIVFLIEACSSMDIDCWRDSTSDIDLGTKIRKCDNHFHCWTFEGKPMVVSHENWWHISIEPSEYNTTTRRWSQREGRFYYWTLPIEPS